MMLIPNRRTMRSILTPVHAEQVSRNLRRNLFAQLRDRSQPSHDAPAADATAIAQAFRLEACAGPARQVTELRRRASLYRSSFVLEEWDVCLDDGSILPLTFKDLSWAAMSP